MNTSNGTAQESLAYPGRRVQRQKIYILPTVQGFGFALVLVVMLVGTINYDSSLGYALTFLLVSVALTSTLYTHRNLAGLLVRQGKTQPAFAGGSVDLQICVQNASLNPRPGLVIIFNHRARGRSERGDHGSAVLDLAGHATRCVSLSVAAPNRGWLRLRKLTMVTRYPFGLFRAWSPVNLDIRCLVYPRAAGSGPLLRQARDNRQSLGESGASGNDFAGLRDYRRGDSPRSIHWKAAARGQGTPVKLFEGNAGADVVVRWQDARGDAEQRISQLAKWVIEAHERQLLWALELPDGALPKAGGEAHYHACLTRLALLQP